VGEGAKGLLGRWRLERTVARFRLPGAELPELGTGLVSIGSETGDAKKWDRVRVCLF